MKDLALQWMEGLSNEWLLIYDNFPDNRRFQPTIPRRNKGNIIYTSRSQGFLTYLPPQCVCEVMPMSEKDALDLLMKVAGRDEFAFGSEEVSAARELVSELGYLPLAIVGAAAYLRERGCPPLVYLQKFHEQRANRPQLLSTPNPDGSFPARPALYTALDLSYDALVSVGRREGQSRAGRAARGALRLLNLLCFYHNEAFPADILLRAAEERLQWGSAGVYPLSNLADDPNMNAAPLISYTLPEGKWNPVVYVLATKVLERYSLIKVLEDDEEISMHVMVRAWAQDRMSEQTRRRQALAARIVLVESIVVGWSNADKAYLRLLPPHVNACMAHEAAAITNDKYQALLDFKLGWYYKEEKQFPSAVKHLSSALRIWKFELGAHSRSATLALGELAKTYHDMGRLSDAEFTYRELMNRLVIRGRDSDRETLANTKAHRLREQERARKQAERQKLSRLLRLRRATDEASKGVKGSQCAEEDRLSVALSTRDPVEGLEVTPGWVGKSTERVIKELEPFKAKDTAEPLSEWRFELASASADLGRVLFDQGRLSVGKKCMLQAIELMKLADSDTRNDIVVWAMEDELKRRSEGGDLDHWAQRYRAIGAFPQDVREDHSVHEHSFTAEIGYADYLLRDECWDEAYRVYERLSHDAPRVYGMSDRKTLFLMRMMALCQYQQGLFEEAEGVVGIAVERAKAAYGLRHFVTAECLEMLFQIKRALILDTDPGGELWNLAQDAYDSARFGLSEDHALALGLKAHLDSYRETPLREGLFREANFETYYEKRGYYPVSMEDFIERLTIEFRELNRTTFQADLRNSKKRKPRLRRSADGIEPGADSHVDDLREAQGAVAEAQNTGTSPADKKWKGKEKESATLSLTPDVDLGLRGVVAEMKEVETQSKMEGKDGTSPASRGRAASGLFKGGTQKVGNGHVEGGSQEALLEESEGEKSKETSPLIIETGADTVGRMSKTPWTRLWGTEERETDVTMTGSLAGEGKAPRRRIATWIPLDDLVKHGRESHVAKPFKLFS